MHISSYECITAAGFGVKSLLKALTDQKVCSTTLEETATLLGKKVNSGGLICRIPTQSNSVTKNILQQLEFCWNKVFGDLKNYDTQYETKRFGIILASTKGILEDLNSNWTEDNIRSFEDPYNPLLKEFISQILSKNISLERVSFSVAISNACSSSHVAIEFAKDSFKSSNVDYIFVISADALGPFVYQGFDSLKVLSHTKNKPFDQTRDGLQLGEASAIILLSRECLSPADICVDAVCSKTVASSITRPSSGGLGLLKALEGLDRPEGLNDLEGTDVLKGLKVEASIFKNVIPDFFIAHGTGTAFNDAAEDEAYQKYLMNLQAIPSSDLSDLSEHKTPLVLNTKWCIGHTLGVSGSIDIIVACEVLKSQKPFNNPSLTHLDPKFSHGKTQYIFDPRQHYDFQSAIVTSLGFGGVQAAIRLTKLNSILVPGVVSNKIPSKEVQSVQQLFFECNVNHRTEPAWKDKVERWSQLDENTYALCCAINEWNSQNLLPKECNLLLISYGGSNIADYEFVKSGMISPSKFVYTLPNVALAAICQIWGWSGKAFVLIKDLKTAENLNSEVIDPKNKTLPTLILESPPKLNKDLRTVRGLCNFF